MTSRPAPFFIAALLILWCAMAAFATSNGAWLTNVSQRERERVNPYRDQPDAVAAGRRIFLDHCAHCHGQDADLHWLLVNGNRSQGMPSWVKLGDPQIWQVICYVKSLH